MADCIAILDFGSQYTQLIARRVREQQVYCEIVRYDLGPREIRAQFAGHDLKGLILSGGPSGVYESKAPRCDPDLFSLGLPTLGICYGMQLGCEVLGGEVAASRKREYGPTDVTIIDADPLLAGIESPTRVWMSHGDRVERLASSFRTIARSESCPHAAVVHAATGFRGLQFHPEVTHTPEGTRLLRNFLFAVCGCRSDWSLSQFTEQTIADLRDRLDGTDVVCALSGGVDSSVVALLLHRAIGERLHCIFVDNGVLRRGERDQVERTFRDAFRMDLHVVDAAKRFLCALEGVVEPEEKRKRIGHTFIDVFREEARSIAHLRYLAQGTLYPDIIESHSALGGPSATIKSHHNVGGLPEELGFELVEPLRFLFKDEVREMGRKLGLPSSIVDRQPFPGPGLAIRVIGAVSRERLEILRNADAIVQEEMATYEDYGSIWQSFAVLLPVQTVGVMGDRRTYEHVAALRIVQSSDGMTADWVPLPPAILSRISNRISNEVQGVNRVVLDITSKPPSTIEWE